MKTLLLCALLGLVNSQFKIPNKEESTVNYWMENMKNEIHESLTQKINTNIAKNVIIFVGDGMGITATTAGRIHKGQKMGFSGEEQSLVWENFPHGALIKTYNLDKQVPDSAATATAFFTGAKANYFTIGVSPKVTMDDWQAALDPETWSSSIMQWGQDVGKETGLVTTTRVTHATPASLYAHTCQRLWECDAGMNETVKQSGTKDIARQLVEDSPGKHLKVIMGGGRSFLGAPLTDDEAACTRVDGRNLVTERMDEHTKTGAVSKYVTNTEQLLALDVENTDFIMGLFDTTHTPFEVDRDTTDKGTPSIKQMTETAIKRLQKSDKGFVLMVEGGRIDSALHMSKPMVALEEIRALDEAVTAALALVNTEETLVIVCADHSHVMTFNGYAERGNDILGKTTYEFTNDELPYPTLMFTTGPGFPGTFAWNGTDVVRNDLTDVDTTSRDWVSPSIVQTKGDYFATHGGEDIGMYAIGPMSHLFNTVHEQPYIAHVMGYSACMGPYADDCGKSSRHTSSMPQSKFRRS